MKNDYISKNPNPDDLSEFDREKEEQDVSKIGQHLILDFDPAAASLRSEGRNDNPIKQAEIVGYNQTGKSSRKNRASTKQYLKLPNARDLTYRERLTPDVIAQFLEALSEYGSAAKACAIIGFPATIMYRFKRNDKEFSDLWDQASDAGANALEDEAKRRAYGGTEQPVYQGKELVGHITKYSDLLLIFLLKGKFPDKYRDRWEGKVTPDTSQATGVDLSALSDEEFKTVRRLVNKAREAKDSQPAKD